MTTFYGGFYGTGAQIQIAVPVCQRCSRPGVVVIDGDRLETLLKKAIALTHPDRHPQHQRRATTTTAEITGLLAELKKRQAR